MEKGYYGSFDQRRSQQIKVAIHNKNGKGLLLNKVFLECRPFLVAIHNKNGKGLLPTTVQNEVQNEVSQSTIKMEKGYYK